MASHPAIKHIYNSAPKKDALEASNQRPPAISGPEILEVGDLLVAYLRQLSIKYVFGVPGGAIEPLYNALARQARYDEENGIPLHARGPRAVVARHETDAAFMAEGYARASGKMGVCCATTGPGATNMITGVASAYENRIPMLVITAQTALANFGRGALQESSCTGVDTVSMFRHCTRYNTLVSHTEQFENKLSAAILSTRQSPAGPAHLSVPLDIMKDITPAPIPTFTLTTDYWSRPISQVDATVDSVFERIKNADKVTFVIGHGCRDAIGIILKVAKLINANIVVTPHGKGLVSPFQPLFRGVFGFAGHESASDALNEANEIVAIGVTISEWSSNGWDRSCLLKDKLIHIDDNEENFTRSPMAGTHILGGAAGIFTYYLEYYQYKPYGEVDTNSDNQASQNWEDPNKPIKHFTLDDEAAFTSDAIPIKPQRLMYELPRQLPSNTRYVVDSGNSTAWALHYLHPIDRRMEGKRHACSSTFDGCIEFASMGWAIGAAIGVALGSTKHRKNRKNDAPHNVSFYEERTLVDTNKKKEKTIPVVCITGDGSLLMAGQEITVAIQEKLPVIFIILNDSSLGMVKHGQRLAGAEPIGYELPKIDYCDFAKVLGAYGERVYSPKDLEEINFEEVLKRPGPTLIDVRIDAEEVPPMATRMKILQDE